MSSRTKSNINTKVSRKGNVVDIEDLLRHLRVKGTYNRLRETLTPEEIRSEAQDMISKLEKFHHNMNLMYIKVLLGLFTVSIIITCLFAWIMERITG